MFLLRMDNGPSSSTNLLMLLPARLSEVAGELVLIGCTRSPGQRLLWRGPSDDQVRWQALKRKK